MATLIDHPLGLGNDDGEFSAMYGTPIKPVLSPITATDNHARENPKDKGLVISAIRLLKAPQVRFLMLGTGRGLVALCYLAMQTTPVLSTNQRAIAGDFRAAAAAAEEEARKGNGTGGFFQGIDLRWTMFAFSLVIFKCTVFITQIAMQQAVSQRQRQRRQPSKEAAAAAAVSDKEPLLLKSEIYLD